MQQAVQRIRKAVHAGEKIAIFGDYDCDGVTATGLMLRCLRRRNVEPLVRLPHRVEDGYGLKTKHVDECSAAGITLLITIDTGVSCAAEVDDAQAKGIDVIILDHHHIPDILPRAFAIVHPDLCPDFPGAPPAAAGVVWSLVCAMEAADGNPTWIERPMDLALAAIGTVGDLVELRDTNRTLVRAGLACLAHMGDLPLAALLEQAGVQNPITSRDIGFRIAPRLNAAGRLASPMIALQAILGDHEAIAELERLNGERQRLVAGLAEGTLVDAGQNAAAFLCLASTECPPGVAGLLASKLTDAFGRPSLVANIRDGACVASLRSVPGYNVIEALTRHSTLLTTFGGHAQAAGCTFPLENWPALKTALEEDADIRIAAEERTPCLLADLALDPQHVTLDLCKKIDLLEPFGQGNMEPRFLLRNVQLTDARAVGRDLTHLQAKIGTVKLIGFQLGQLCEYASGRLDILCRVGIDTWQGRVSPQLFIDDLRLASVQTGASLPSIEKTSVTSAVNAAAIL